MSTSSTIKRDPEQAGGEQLEPEVPEASRERERMAESTQEAARKALQRDSSGERIDSEETHRKQLSGNPKPQHSSR